MPGTLKLQSAPALRDLAGSSGSPVLRMALVLMFFLSAVGIVAAAESIRPFTSGSLKQVLASRPNKPFILVLWSLDCQYCPTELKMLSELEKSHPGLDVVLIATDTIDDMPQLAARATNYGTAKFEQWVFAEDMPERLRQEIDGRWYGEVPRTYFYDQKHQRTVRMGLINKSLVEEWLSRNTVDTANGKQDGKH
jgi:thiol-disulfide isomerase/thioredoxin